MTAHSEEALSLLLLARRDWEILAVIKDAPKVHLSGVCFHAQQCAEKALKAVLAARGGELLERTHDLIRLAVAVGKLGLDLPVDIEALNRLNPCAVTYRYDDKDVDTLSRAEAVDMAASLLGWAEGLVA